MSTIKIPKELKEVVIQWQGLLEYVTGKNIPRGVAVALACRLAIDIIQKIPIEVRIKASPEHAAIFETLADEIIDQIKEFVEKLEKGENEARKINYYDFFDYTPLLNIIREHE